IDAKDPGKSFELLVDIPRDAPPGTNPFDAATTPVKLTAAARKLPQWDLAWNGVVAFDPPATPVRSSEPQERVTLVPFGAQDLRVTDFPVLGDLAGAGGVISQPLTFPFDTNATTGWS